MAARVFRQRGRARLEPARPGPRAAVSQGAQQELEFRRRGRGRGRLRPQQRACRGAGAALAAAHHPSAGPARQPSLRVPGDHRRGFRLEAVCRHARPRLLSIPGHPQQRSVRRAGRSRRSAARGGRRARLAPLRRCRAAGDRPGLPRGDPRLPARSVRSDRGRSLQGVGTREPEPLDGGLRSRRSGGAQVRAVRAEHS